jgi:hypothetical protein
MANETLEISSILQNGLRPEDRDNRGLVSAAEFRGMYPTSFGARIPDDINNIVSLSNLYNATTLAAYQLPEDQTFPTPQIIIGKSKSLILNETRIAEFDHVAGTVSGALNDIRTVAQVEADSSGSTAIPANGGFWHIADFGDAYYLFCDDLVVVRSPFLKAADDGTATYFQSAAVTIKTGCAFRGQLICGGFDTSDYHSAAWVTLWDAWTTEAASKGIATTAAKGPGQNWVRWGTIGGGDLILHWFPTTFARFGGRTQALGWQEATDVGEHIANGSAADGLLGWNPISAGTFGGIADTWSVQTKTAKVAFVEDYTTAGSSLQMKQTIQKEFKSGRTYDVSINMLTSAGAGKTLQVYMGPDPDNPLAISSAQAVASADTWTVKTFSLTPSADTNEIAIKPNTVAGSGYLAFTEFSVVDDTPSGTLDGFDSDSPYFWEFLRRGDLGFMPMPTQGTVINTTPLRDRVVVFSDDAVHGMNPVVADGLPTYGLEEHVHHAGILSRSAVASNGKDLAVFIDETGELQAIDGNLNVERLGFREYFEGKTDLIGGYDPVKKAFYLGDEDETFRLDKDGKLSQVEERRVTSIFSSGGALAGMADIEYTSLGSITLDYNGDWTQDTVIASGETIAELNNASSVDPLSSVETFTTVVGQKYFIRIGANTHSSGVLTVVFAGVTAGTMSLAGVHEFTITATSTSSKLVITPAACPNGTKVSADMLLVADAASTDFSIESDYYDFHHAGMKTLEWLEMDYKDITTPEITITYYVDQDDASPMTIGPLVGNNGQYYVGIAFTHLKIKIEGLKGTDPSITRLDAKFSYTDDRTQRHSRGAPSNKRSITA